MEKVEWTLASVAAVTKMKEGSYDSAGDMSLKQIIAVTENLDGFRRWMDVSSETKTKGSLLILII